MLNRLIIVLSLIFNQFLFSQYDIVIEAFVFDSETKKPINLANINFKFTSIGTLSNETGKFKLQYEEDLISDEDILEISAKGFNTIEVRAEKLYKFLANTNKLYLKRDKSNYWANDLSISLIEDQSPKLFGKVFNVKGPIQGATIRIKNSLVESQSDFEGYFNIDAKLEDILVINYLGMIEKQITVEDFNDTYILLKTEAEILDEVVLSSENSEDNLVDTGYGKKNKDAVGFATSTITKDNFSPGATTLVEVIRGQFAGVRVEETNPPRIEIRGGTGSMNTPAYAIYDIDGLIFEDFPTFIDPQQIESITILKSYGATNRYGSQGRGGVFVIKMNNLYQGSAQKLDSALIKGNDYVEQLELFENTDISNFTKELELSASFEEAKNIYISLSSNINSIPFYLDCYDYFIRWDNEFAISLLTDAVLLAKTNAKALKSIAYKMESIGENISAESIYEHLVKIRPKHEQSYRDLALIYTKNKKYVQAAELYKRILLNDIDGVEVLGLEKTIANEAYRFFEKYKSQFDFKNFPINKLRSLHPEYIWKDFGYDYRIVFDWSDSNIEFNVQFVSPSKKYFNWSHTKFENKEQLVDEIKFGYNTEEFIIDDSIKGEWLVNIDSFSIESDVNPTYLKYTVYKNYGRDNEIKKTQVINLNVLKGKITLDKLFYN